MPEVDTNSQCVLNPLSHTWKGKEKRKEFSSVAGSGPPLADIKGVVTGVIPRITIQDGYVARAPSLSGDVCALSGDGGVAASATMDRRTHCVQPWN